MGFLERARTAVATAAEIPDALHDEDRVVSWISDGGDRPGRARHDVEEAIAARLDRATGIGRTIGARAGYLAGGVAAALLIALLVAVLTWT